MRRSREYSEHYVIARQDIYCDQTNLYLSAEELTYWFYDIDNLINWTAWS